MTSPPRRSPRLRARSLTAAFTGAAIAALACADSIAAAQSPPPPGVFAPAGHGQQALAVGLDGTGGLRARVCAGTCSPDGGALLPVPDDARRGLSAAKLSTIELADGKLVVRADVPSATEGASFVMLLAAPLGGKGSEPLVIWSGVTGAAKGEIGEERSAAVIDEPAGKKGHGRRVLVGERRGDVTLCGRPTVVAAKELDPATLSLARGASVQNLSDADRAGATKLAAKRMPGKPAAGGPNAIRLLRATAASSAVEKKFGTLTDGDLESAWSENKQGDGRGEFVTIGSASEVGITSFELSIKPSGDVPDGAAPKTLYLVTPDRVLEVTMPEDAWRQPAGTRYEVKLAAELHASCVSVVLGESYAPAGARAARVTIAEIEAKTPFDGASVESLAGALAGGGDRSKGAAAMLARAGKAGVTAAIAGYPKLDDAGRQLAAGVVDAAPCADQVPFWAERLVAASAVPEVARPGGRLQKLLAATGEDQDPELIHARDRLRRCGRLAAPALAKIIAGAKGGDAGAAKARQIAADELSLVAPGEAVPALLDALGGASEAARRDLRAALGRAAQSARALGALRDEVEPAKLKARPEEVAIDLLRAIGPSLGKVEGAGAAFASLATKEASFRSRFLLQAPAAELARAGDAGAAAWLRASLRSDEDAHVRGRAAEVAAKVPALGADLVAAIDDPEVRVRDAAINALADAASFGATAPAGLAASLQKRLAGDDWTFVRAGAARALGALPADPSIDQALATALADGAPDVRGRVLDALGAHRATAFAEQIRERQDDAAESLEVRARAILSLASMCDARSVAAWTKLARGAKAPGDERDRRLGTAAIAALGMLQPKDLADRLAPLLEKDTPPPVREMARAAMGAKSDCR